MRRKSGGLLFGIILPRHSGLECKIRGKRQNITKMNLIKKIIMIHSPKEDYGSKQNKKWTLAISDNDANSFADIYSQDCPTLILFV